MTSMISVCFSLNNSIKTEVLTRKVTIVIIKTVFSETQIFSIIGHPKLDKQRFEGSTLWIEAAR